MVSRAPVVSSAHRRASTTSGGSGMLSARHRRRTNSLSAKRVASSGEWNPTLVAEMPVAASAPMVEFTGLPAAVASVDSQPERARRCRRAARRSAPSSARTYIGGGGACQAAGAGGARAAPGGQGRRVARRTYSTSTPRRSRVILCSPRGWRWRVCSLSRRCPGCHRRRPWAGRRRSRRRCSAWVCRFPSRRVDAAPGGERFVVPHCGGWHGWRSGGCFAEAGLGQWRGATGYVVQHCVFAGGGFRVPVPPQRMKEQLSDDGTLLSRAGCRSRLCNSSGGSADTLRWARRRCLRLRATRRCATAKARAAAVGCRRRWRRRRRAG